MTAPLFNLPITSPVAGGPAANAAQGPMAGFEALLAAFFGGQGDPAAGGLFGQGQTAEGDAAAVKDADGQTIPALSADAQALAAMLAAPTAQVAVELTTAEGETATPAGGSATPATPFAGAPAADAAAITAAAAAAGGKTKGEKAAVTGPVAALVDEPVDAQPAALATEGAIETALSATDPAVTTPATAQVPETKPAAETKPATPAPVQAPAVPAPAPPPPVEAAPVAQAAAVASETASPQIEPEAEPVEAHAAPRSTKQADATRRNADPAAAAPVGETHLPDAVKPVASAEASHKSASTIEPDAPAPTTPDAKPKAAADAPDFQAQAPAAAAHSQVAAAQAAPVRATPETVANLTAQIAKKAEGGRSTKFDVQLNPAGLGHVNVSVEIAASGKMTAAMSFDSPQAAAELRSRSHELHKALEQAGFDVSGGLTFDVMSDRGDGRGAPQQQQQQADGAAWRGRAFQAVLGTAGEAAETASNLALNYGRRTTSGVDVRI